jgi:putative transposase
VSGQLERFATQMRRGLLAASVTIGLEVTGELLEAEVTDVAGPKGRHDPNRSAYRHGRQDGKVTLGGRRVPISRPRVRSVAGEDVNESEVHSESYDTFAQVDLLADHMVASMLAGLSTRATAPAWNRWARPSKRWHRGYRVRRSAAGSAP